MFNDKMLETGGVGKLGNLKPIEENCNKVLAFVKDLLVMNGVNYKDIEKNRDFNNVRALVVEILANLSSRKYDKRIIMRKIQDLREECEKLNKGAVMKLVKPLSKGAELPAFNAVKAAILRVEEAI